MTENASHQPDGQSSRDFQTQHLESPSFRGQSSPQNTEDTMVGHAKEFEEFKKKLFLSSNEPLQVMSLVGMGGIGKKTFARRIYDESSGESHFDCCGWATMSQEHNKKQVLLQLCCSVMSLHDDINNKDDGELAEQLRRSLLGKRYLIIVDDIWTTDAWDDVQRCFPEEDENTGSRILLTTRLKEVANYACSGNVSYDMRFLDSVESWNLLFSQKILVKERLNERFETIGKNIVQKCHGLPLIVVVLSGHLSTNMDIDEWKNVESMLNSLVNLDNTHLELQQFSRILTLSYNNLPCHLKSCFLYLGVFPEDFEIEIKKVIRLWIAEGFMKEVSDQKTTLEELGEVYLHELVSRSLIMISGRSIDGKIKTCKMHDILHDLCVSKVKNEKLMFAIGRGHTELHMDGCRWLTAKYSTDLIYCEERCEFRSILCFERSTYDATCLIEIVSFKMLRVLDMSAVSMEGSIPNCIMVA